MEIKTGREETSGYFSWRVESGERFQIKTQRSDRPDWYWVKVPNGYQVLIGQGSLRNDGKIGVGKVANVDGDNNSFFSNEVMVSAGKPARIFFRKKAAVGKKLAQGHLEGF